MTRMLYLQVIEGIPNPLQNPANSGEGADNASYDVSVNVHFDGVNQTRGAGAKTQW